jgi:ABC-type Mn2+/Zn2+ transport system ATPase subunit
MRALSIDPLAAIAVRVRALSVRYGPYLALEHVDVGVCAGQALGIIGPNGSGKSTLLKAVAGLITPASGSIEVFGMAPRALRPGAIAYVPQVEAVDWSFPVSVWDVVAMGRFPRLGVFRRFGTADRAAVSSALEALGLSALRDRHISQLSGGQQQRVFVARAIAQEPRLLLLDEPTTGVDAATEAALCKLIRRLVGQGLPVLVATHDVERANEWFDRLLVLDRRVIAEGETAAVRASGAYAAIRERPHAAQTYAAGMEIPR